MALRDMRLAMLVLCPNGAMPDLRQENPRLRAAWEKSFSTVHTRRFFETLVFGCRRMRRSWSANDTARAEAESPFVFGWRVILFDPKRDLEEARSLPEHYGFPIPLYFL
jgi:hypothetical protein